MIRDGLQFWVKVPGTYIGICLCYSADELLKDAQLSITEDNKIRIEIGDYDIGGEEMDFYCTAFETENISFNIPQI